MSIRYAELRRLYRTNGAAGAARHLGQALQEGHLKPSDFSIRELAEELVPDGHEWVRKLDSRKKSGFEVFESAGGAVDTTAFSNITGQIVYSAILESYQSPFFIADQLCTTIPTVLSGEKIPGTTNIGDNAESVGEGEEYPRAGISDQYIETPQTTKSGLIVEVTREAIFFDRTNLVLRRCSEVGTALGYAKEKAVMDMVTGQSQSYSRNGTAYNTYYATGGFGQVNQITDVLENWTDLDAAEQAFANLVDWGNGEPIVVQANTILVPRQLLPTLKRILTATEVRHDANPSAGTANIATLSSSPLDTYTALSSPYVYRRTSSATNWWMGDFKKAFAYMENWPIQVVQAPAGNEAQFTRDVEARFKASERGACAVIDPLQVVMSTGGG